MPASAAAGMGAGGLAPVAAAAGAGGAMGAMGGMGHREGGGGGGRITQLAVPEALEHGSYDEDIDDDW
ncbi:Uncharacterised protein [Mycobacteroides abscessus subsp. abscessus]|nr:Uncharacterised protein [Mycobacteroides abscessus subsp. abscessus]